MSLDVYLNQPGVPASAPVGSGIFIRENGSTREIARVEWDRRYPGKEPATFRCDESDDEDTNVFHANITHNLNRMASEAGIYEHLWRPDEIGITKARELIEPLRAGLAKLEGDPEWFKKCNPSNGWGTYEGLVQFVRDYLAACEKFPEADVSVWR